MEKLYLQKSNVMDLERKDVDVSGDVWARMLFHEFWQDRWNIVVDL